MCFRKREREREREREIERERERSKILKDTEKRTHKRIKRECCRVVVKDSK